MRLNPLRVYGLVILIVTAAVTMPAQAEDMALTAARAHYNAGRFAEAMTAARAVWQETGHADAGLVLARAGLEWFRVTADPVDLDAARATLRRLDPVTLNPEQVGEWEVGVAQALFLQEQFGAAAELFGRLLETADSSSLGARDRLLDWWATATERLASEQAATARAHTYDALVRRLEDEFARFPTSAATPFWLAAAARAAGAPDRAWHLAIAGWVRAPRAGPAQDRLRADLDRLVLQGIIPDLAMLRTGEAVGHEATVNTMAALAAQWEELTEAWAP